MILYFMIFTDGANSIVTRMLFLRVFDGIVSYVERVVLTILIDHIYHEIMS